MRTVLSRTAPSPGRTEGRLLHADERAVVQRMCAALPDASVVVADLHLVRVREAVGWMGECSARLVVAVEHWDRRAGVGTLPVRGFLVDGWGRAEGEVALLAAGGHLLGLRVRGLPERLAPSSLDPARVRVVPWAQDSPGPRLAAPWRDALGGPRPVSSAQPSRAGVDLGGARAS